MLHEYDKCCNVLVVLDEAKLSDEAAFYWYYGTYQTETRLQIKSKADNCRQEGNICMVDTHTFEKHNTYTTTKSQMWDTESSHPSGSIFSL